MLQADKRILADIKKFQARVKVEDSLVEEAIRESTRSYVEGRLEKAVQCLKQRGRVRDYSDLVKVWFSLSVNQLCRAFVPDVRQDCPFYCPRYLSVDVSLKR